MTDASMTPDRERKIRMSRTHCEADRRETEDERPLHVWGPSQYPTKEMCQRCTVIREWAEDPDADEVALLAEVDRLRKALSDAADQVAELEDDLGKASAEAATLRQRLHEAAMARVWTNEDGKKFVFADDLKGPLLGKAPVRDLRSGAAAARRLLRRPGACFTCGDVPDEWCPDCACCKAGCDGGRTNNPCTHPNAPWNTVASR